MLLQPCQKVVRAELDRVQYLGVANPYPLAILIRLPCQTCWLARLRSSLLRSRIPSSCLISSVLPKDTDFD